MRRVEAPSIADLTHQLAASVHRSHGAPPTERGAIRAIVISAAIAHYPYSRDLEAINQCACTLYGGKTGEWQQDPVLSEYAFTALMDLYPTLSLNDGTGLIHDKQSGLTAYILVNMMEKEIRVVFGGSSSGQWTGDLTRRCLYNAWTSLRQWQANLQNAFFNKIPTSYKQAAHLTRAVIAYTHKASNPYQGYRIITSGHSKGGGEATFAALKQDPMLTAYCFGSAELGAGLLASTQKSPAQLNEADITHYNIAGDIIPNMRQLFSNLTLIGQTITFPALLYQSPLGRHDQFLPTIMKYAERFEDR